MTDTIKPGDYFLLPFKGDDTDNLVRVIEPLFSSARYDGLWKVENVRSRHRSYCLLSSCHPIPQAEGRTRWVAAGGSP